MSIKKDSGDPNSNETYGNELSDESFVPEGVATHWLTVNGTTINKPEEIPRRVVIRKIDHEADYYAPFHSHARGQLLFLAEGLIQVSTKGEGYWVVPPQRAVWLPPYAEHDARSLNKVKLRNVYISKEASQSLPRRCQVISITPLLRELILSAAEFDVLYDEQGPEGHLIEVLLDQLAVQPEVPLHLPHPTTKALKTIAEHLIHEPADQRALKDWAQNVGLSARTLARHFVKETGMSFGQWRQQARLLAAITRISQGVPVAHIAQDLGYDSQSAFIAMFRKAMGTTPGRYCSR
jgi:AraC-like DNA-binding protein